MRLHTSSVRANKPIDEGLIGRVAFVGLDFDGFEVGEHDE